MRRRSLTGSTWVTSSSPRKIRPLVGSIRRLTIFMVVVLPQPEGPTRTQRSPVRTSRLNSSTATWSPKRLVTLSSRITRPNASVPLRGCDRGSPRCQRPRFVDLVGLGGPPRRHHLHRGPGARRADVPGRRHRSVDLVAPRAGRVAVAVAADAHPGRDRGALHHPLPRPVRPPDPDHRPREDDGRDRPRQLHAADPGPERRDRAQCCPRRRAGGRPRHGLHPPAPAGPNRSAARCARHRGRHPRRHRNHHRASDGYGADRPGRPRPTDLRRVGPRLPHAPGRRRCPVGRTGRDRRSDPGRCRAVGYALVARPSETGVEVDFLGRVADWSTDPAHWHGTAGIPNRLSEHMVMSLAAVVTAIVIALPIGLILGHTGRGGTLAINVSNIGRAIPSFAMLVLGVQLFGIGAKPAFIALVALAMPPIVTNAYIGIREV